MHCCTRRCARAALETDSDDSGEGLTNYGATWGNKIGPHCQRRMKWTSGHACLPLIAPCSVWLQELQRHWMRQRAGLHLPGVGQTRQLAPFAWEPGLPGIGSRSGLRHLYQTNIQGAEGLHLNGRAQADVHIVGLVAHIKLCLSRASALGQFTVQNADHWSCTAADLLQCPQECQCPAHPAV